MDKPEKVVCWIKPDDYVVDLIHTSDTPVEGWTRVEFDGAVVLEFNVVTDSKT